MLAWLDSASLVLSRRAEPGAPSQLWRLSYPEGTLSRLTNDLNSYAGISVTADRSSLVTAQRATRVGFWVGDGLATRGTEIVPPALGRRGDVAWASDRLVYTTLTSGQSSIVGVAPGRGTPEEMVLKGTAPAATSDGRTIVYVSTESGAHAGLWKADADGRHATQLVSGPVFVDVSSPAVTPDDCRVVFISLRGGEPTAWTVSLDGGMPTQLTDGVAVTPDVSSDGKLAFGTPDPQTSRPSMVVCDPPNCTARRRLAAPTNLAAVRLKWTPDGRAVAYIDTTLSNLWVLPIDGRAPSQLTHFTDGRTLTGGFAWSHDGKRLAIARSVTTNDIVLFRGLKR